ncbi:hypothetical protein BsWGS_23834 [Bradybaena similaris]
MDITQDNFKDQLSSIYAAIQECDFVAVDCEFSGLDCSAPGHATCFDTPEERYQKIKANCSEFIIVQFGLCAFKAVPQNKIYEAKPFNFYIFPTLFSRHAPDRRFLCQSSSIDFLRSHGFNFYKLFTQGIPYLTQEEEKNLRAKLTAKAKKHLSVPEDQKSFLNNIREQLSQYFKGQDTMPFKIVCSAFQRRLIHQTFTTEFPEAHFVTVKKKNESICMVMRAESAEQQQDLLNENQKIELDKQLGFSKVIRCLTSSGKLIVGHNMILDVFHIIHNFHGALPADLEDFRTVTKSLFPRLLDTKLMANTQPLKENLPSSVLQKMFTRLQSPPFIPAQVEIPPGYERYKNEAGALHEAGYDALVTGRCFTTMVNYLGGLQSPPTEFTLSSSSVVSEFINKIYITQSKDIAYINLDIPDVNSNEHVFHVTVPEDCSSEDLHNLFKPYGDIQISWLTKKTVKVQLHEKQKAILALQELSKVDSFHVVTYASYQLSKSSICSASSSSACAPAASSSASAPRVSSKHKLECTDVDLPCKVIHLSPDEVSPAIIPGEDQGLSDNVNENSDKQSSDTKKC